MERGLSKTYPGKLADYVSEYCKKAGINRLNAMTSHDVLATIAVDWFSEDKWEKYRTRYLQIQVMNAIRYTKRGKELFYNTGRYMDYSGIRGFNKPTIYGLMGTENEDDRFYEEK